MRRVRVYTYETRIRARQLREQGLTYTEICDQLGPIPQATLSGWLKSIRLNRVQRQRIRTKIVESAAQGRPLARQAWARKIALWREGIDRRVAKLGPLPFLDATIGKLVCGMMYLCEGGKYPASRHLSFVNTDSRMITTFVALLRQYFPTNDRKFRIRVMHRWDQDGNALCRYWSEVTGIPLSQFQRSYADRRTQGQSTGKANYKGVCCVQYGDTSLQYELQAIGEAVLNWKVGGAEGDRTPGLLDAIQALSQLSYCPKNSASSGATP